MQGDFKTAAAPPPWRGSCAIRGWWILIGTDHALTPQGRPGLEVQRSYGIIVLPTDMAPYLQELKGIITQFDPNRSNRYFLFGSATRNRKFHDIDLAVVGNQTTKKDLAALKDQLYDSTIPYKVDVVDFDGTDPSFREFVLGHEPIIWI